MDWLRTVNGTVNQIVWGPYMLLLLIGVGVFYTVKLRFFQVVHFRTWWRCTVGSLFRRGHSPAGRHRLSPFQAMAAALAGSVGTGNIVGVANAIVLGGAGAVFWMWIAALFGMATVMAETVLGVKFREKRGGKYVGGPMYYIEKGLGCRWLAAVFAGICTLSALGMGNLTQGNSVAGAMEQTFGVPPVLCGIVLSVLVGVIIFGGIERIAGLTEKLVPVMTILYIGVILIILCLHYRELPAALQRIFTEAFDLRAASGGFMGYGMARAIKYGVSRGVFSNEAGLGTSPIIHAAADTDDPYRQGMWGIFQVFLDTIVLCTLMALCILTTGADSSGLDGISLSAYSFESALGEWGSFFLSVSLILFAFGTLISWSYYGEKSLEYLTGGRFTVLYRLFYAGATFLGCVSSLSLVWEISDTLNGLMAIPNLAALLLLSPHVRSGVLLRSGGLLRKSPPDTPSNGQGCFCGQGDFCEKVPPTPPKTNLPPKIHSVR